MTDTPPKSAQAFRTIGEVADELGVAQHVLRFWETRFPSVQPLKRGGNRRYYRPADVTLLRDIHRMLHAEGYTIKGVQKLLEARGKGGPAAGGSDKLSPGGLAGPNPGGDGAFRSVQAEPAGARPNGPDLAAIRAVRDRLVAGLAAARA